MDYSVEAPTAKSEQAPMFSQGFLEEGVLKCIFWPKFVLRKKTIRGGGFALFRNTPLPDTET